MDELQLLRDMRAEVPEPEPARLRRIRPRLAAHAQPGTGRTALRVPARWVAIPAAALAAAVAIAALAAPDGGAPEPRPDAQAGVAPGPMTAADFLLSAADTVARNPAPRARPDQWIYTKNFNDFSPFGNSRKLGFRESEVWYQVDGTHYAADFGTGRVATRRQPDEGEGDARTPKQLYRFVASMPEDPAALLESIYERDEFTEMRDRRPELSKEAYAFDFIGMLLRNPSIALQPEPTAALFRAMARIPDVAMNRDAVDAADRRGVGLSMPADPRQGMTYELIFDAGSGRFLGDRFIVTDPTVLEPPGTRNDPPLHEGQKISDNARLTTAIVDRAGQRP